MSSVGSGSLISDMISKTEKPTIMPLNPGNHISEDLNFKNLDGEREAGDGGCFQRDCTLPPRVGLRRTICRRPPRQVLDPPQMSADLLSRYYCSRLSLQSLNKTDGRL